MPKRKRVRISKKDSVLCDYEDVSIALFDASRKGDLNIVKHILSLPGVDVTDKEFICEGNTSLYIASRMGHIEVVRELLKSINNNDDRVAYINKQQDHGNTALHGAVAERQIEIIKELFKQPGINVNIQDFTGNTPFRLACLYEYEQVMQELLKHPEVDVEIPNNAGTTPLCLIGHITLKTKYALVKLILKHTYFSSPTLISRHLDDSTRNDWGDTVLGWTIQERHMRNLKFLVTLVSVRYSKKNNCAFKMIPTDLVRRLIVEHLSVVDY